MTLRRKTLLIVGITLIGLIGLLFANSRVFVLESFIQLEEKTVRRNVQRAQLALSDTTSSLATMVEGWAARDDVYAFVQDANPAFVETYLADSTFKTLRLNAIVFVDMSGATVFAQGFDLIDAQKVAVSSSLEQHMDDILPYSSALSKLSGIVMLPEGPMLIATAPVLPVEATGPVHGTLVFGRYLDEADLERLARANDFSLALYEFDSTTVPTDVQRARSHLGGKDQIHIAALGSQVVAGYYVLNDIAGNPALLIKVEMAREIYEQGWLSLVYFLVVLVSSGFAFGIIILVLLEQTVLSRLRRLGASVNQVRMSGDLSLRVSINGKDELSELATAVNNMLHTLDESQKTIRESRERLHTVIANAPVILYALDDAGAFTFLEGQGLADINPQEYIGRPVYDLLHDVPSIEQIAHLDNAGAATASVATIQGRTFEIRQLRLNSNNGGGNGFIGVATDVTDRKLAEAAEHEQRVMAEALRDTAWALAGTLNLDEVLERILTNVGHVVPHDAANIMLIETGEAVVARSRGYDAHGLENAICTLRVAVDSVPHLQRVVESGQSLIVSDARASGDWAYDLQKEWVRSYAAVPILLDGHTIGVLILDSATCGFFTPPHAERLKTFANQAALALRNAQFYETEQHKRRLAQTLLRTAQALASSIQLEDVFDLVLEQLGQVVDYDRVMIMLVEDDVLRVSSARGFPQVDSICGTTYWFAEVPLLDQAIRTGELVVLTDAQHDPRWAQMPKYDPPTRAWIGMPLIAHSTAIGFLAVASHRPNVYDESDLEVVATFAQQAALAVYNAHIIAKLEASLLELREAQSHLERTARLSAAGEIATGVAHQINNPLTTVIAESHLLMLDFDSQDPRYESVQAIREAATRAGAVVRRLLNLTRTHAYEMVPVDVNSSLQDSVAIIRAQIEPHVARLEMNLAPDLPMLKGSIQHLEDVWVNLLINARDAVSQVEGGVIKVVSRLNAVGDAIEVIVQDNGIGIPADDLHYVFKAFFTTKSSGTGLGLSISHDVVVHHGGRIEVDSVEGQGTTFTITFPLGNCAV